MSSEELTRVDPVRASVTVRLAPDAAFRLFTEGFEGWWPVENHAIEAGPDTRAILEPRAGGRIFERHRDGSEDDWGRILVWEPPDRVTFTWNPSRHERPTTEVEVRFTAEEGGTRVDLVHRGWERLGDGGGDLRASYRTGWPAVLARFAAAR